MLLYICKDKFRFILVIMNFTTDFSILNIYIDLSIAHELFFEILISDNGFVISVFKKPQENNSRSISQFHIDFSKNTCAVLGRHIGILQLYINLNRACAVLDHRLRIN